jgi:hypothetical protein
MPDQIQDIKQKVLKEILTEGMVNEGDLKEVFEAILSVVKSLSDQFEQKMAENKGEMTEEMMMMHKEMKEAEREMKELMVKMEGKMGVDMKRVMEQCMAKIKEVEEMMPMMPDLLPLEQRITDVEKKIPKIPDEITPYQVRDKLEKLEGDERLDKSAIKGLDEIEKLAKQPKSPTSVFGARGIQLYVDGEKKGMVQMVNLIPGAGVSLTYSQAYGRNDITISASGAALSILTATGAINGINTDFTFISKPNIVIVNGASYQENNGWSWNGGTLTATLDFAPDTGGNVYAI